MIWFIATALMVVTVLVVGTMAAAGLIGRSERPEPVKAESREREREREREHQAA